MSFKPIPDESALPRKAHFTLRKIRKYGDANLISQVENLLVKFVRDGEDMLLSEMSDLINALHRVALQVQRSKRSKLIHKLRQTARTKLKTSN